MFRTYSKWSSFSDFQDTNIAVIEENAQNQTANPKKGTESQKCFRRKREEFECI
jgi:hypothetical protein